MSGYRPSESFAYWSNKKAQRKAGKKELPALTYYAEQARKLRESEVKSKS